MNYSAEYNEIKKSLLQYADKDKASVIKRYMNTKLDVLGLTVPLQRKQLKKGYSFLDGNDQQILNIFNDIVLHGKIFEVKGQAFLYYTARKSSLTLKEFAVMKRWAGSIDNWEHSDRLSDIYSTLFEQYPKQLLPVFKKWNQDRNPWKRRQSIVSLLYYARFRKSYPSFTQIISLVTPLMSDKDVYVQKGVGWTLRECYNVYAAETLDFLFNHAKEIHPIAWQAASEKLSVSKKKKLKQLRNA